MIAAVKPYRVAVCVPSTGTVLASFMYDIVGMMTYTAIQRPDIELHLFLNRGSLLPQLRETLVEQALAVRATHVLFLDSDMRFPKDTLIRLLAHDLPLVAVNYPTRNPPHRPIAMSKLGDESTYLYEGSGLERVAMVGFGAMLASAGLLRAMGQPRFMIGWSKEQKGYAGEDVYFCMQAARAGFGPVVDHDLSAQIAHTGDFEYTLEHALYAKTHATPDATPEPEQPSLILTGA